MWLEEFVGRLAGGVLFLYRKADIYISYNLNPNCYPPAVLSSQIKMLKNAPGLDLCLKIFQWDPERPEAFHCGMWG